MKQNQIIKPNTIKAIWTKPIIKFGKYKIKQVNSSEGYKKVEDFEINVEDTKKETIKLYDYKIKVPNTSIDNQNINKELILILLGVINIIYVKKRIYNQPIRNTSIYIYM